MPNVITLSLPARTNYCHDDVAAVVLNAPCLDFIRSNTEHQLERDWGCCTLEQHHNPAWLDGGSFRWGHYNAGFVVVLAASRRGQQDGSDGGAWQRCWDEVALLHVVKRYERICISLLCCQLKPL